MDLKQSFFVGDAAGRPKDHSAVDQKFAAAAGIPFFTETEFFRDEQFKTGWPFFILNKRNALLLCEGIMD